MREPRTAPGRDSRAWWNAKKGEVNKSVIPYVSTVENAQAELFDKFVKLEATYDTNPRTNRHASAQTLAQRLGRAKSIVTENLIATNVDTVAANVATTDVRARIETDEADWGHIRRAKQLELYGNGLSKLYEIGPKCRMGFKSGAAMKGTGINKVWTDQFDDIRVTPVPIDNIVVDEMECRDGRPKHLHYRDFYDREDLAAQFPDHTDAIMKAQTEGNWRLWAGYRPLQSFEIVAIESWRLPIGPKGHPRHRPGRRSLTIDGFDLLDEEYEDTFFPFSKMVWNAPIWGFYGISLAERILPHQNLLNRRNYQINRSLDLKADPITYVHQADQNLAVKTVSQIGTIVPYNVEPPKTIDHQAVGAETYQSRIQIKEDAAAEARVNQMMAQGGVPKGIESGVGVREARSTNTQGFSIQEKAFETFWLDTLWLVLQCCKKLGDKAPKILNVSKYGNSRIEWSKVDMLDLKIQLQAASDLSNTPAGRQQRVVELAQAGVITIDEARELMAHPDIDAQLSLYNAAIEDIDHTIELILDGEVGIVPLPYQNLKIGVWRFQQKYLLIHKLPNVPEEVLEALDAWIAIAANILNPPELGPGPGDQAAMPGMGGAMPPPSAGPLPVGGNAQGAFAPNTYAPMNA